MQQPKSTPSFAGQFLKDYRKSHHLSQEELAFDLGVEPRTLRAYENGERPLNNINELRRIADLLGIEPERLGVAASLYVPRTSEQIEEIVDHVWTLFKQARFVEARTAIEALIRNVRSQLTKEDPPMLRALAHAHQAAGQVTAVNSRISGINHAIRHYLEIEDIARVLDDQTLLNIALTYHGNMLRRQGDVNKAIEYLEAARDATPLADAAARGNCVQLLARALVQKGDINGFERAMAASEELAYAADPATSSITYSFNIGTIYEEYGKSYGRLGRMQESLNYLDRAEKVFPQTKHWSMVLKAARAETLIRGGEFASGGELAVEATSLARQHNHYRLLERLHRTQRYLEQHIRAVEQINISFRDALDGPIGH